VTVSPIAVTVSFVSGLGALAGTGEASIELLEEATLAALIDALRKQFPALSPVVDRAAYLVNAQRATPETTLSDGDRVLVMQLLGGG
jgi:molybdopterin converting factor small subunit